MSNTHNPEASQDAIATIERALKALEYWTPLEQSSRTIDDPGLFDVVADLRENNCFACQYGSITGADVYKMVMDRINTVLMGDHLAAISVDLTDIKKAILDT